MRSKLLAACTTLVLALGFTLGGASVAFAATPYINPEHGAGTTCNGIGYDKPAELDNLEAGTGSESYSWGSISWSGNDVSWTVNAGWEVDICVKGGNVGPSQFFDQDEADSYTHSHGVSHLGYRATFTAPVAAASIGVTTADCDNDTVINFGGASISNATWGTPVIDGDEISVTATATGGALFDGGLTTKTFTFPYQQAPVGDDCEQEPGVAGAAITVTDPNCFDTTTGIAPDEAGSSNVASWSAVTTEVDGDDTYLVITATAADDYLFAEGDGVSEDRTTKTFRVLQETVDEEDCVLPAIGVVADSSAITCDLDGWFSFGPGVGVSEDDAALLVWTVGPVAYAGNDEPGVQHPVAEGVTITVTVSLVESAQGDYALNDESGDGDVNEETGAITWTFLFTAADDCLDGAVVPLVTYVDDCEEMSYTIYKADGVTYTRTINGFEFPVTFDGDDESVTYTAALLDDVTVTATADDGFVLPDDYEPWSYQFVEGFCPDTGPATTASVEFTLGECEGDSSVELTDEGGVIWRINGEIVDGNTTHALAAGSDVEVTATLEGASDEYPLGWTWSDPEQVTSWEESVAASDPNCSPELAYTGIGSFSDQLGAIALLLTLAGVGLVVRRHRVIEA